MVAKVGKKKLVLVADIQPVQQEQETHATPWGRVWTRGSDVMATWRRHGYIPPTEYRSDYFFGINRNGGVV